MLAKSAARGPEGAVFAFTMEEKPMSAEDALKLISDSKAKFVDFRFTDTHGKEQHVSVPASVIDGELFEEGKMFDGSSIAGWKGINESDMILMPENLRKLN